MTAKHWHYFLLASLPVLTPEKMPQTGWEWWVLGIRALLAGLIATKALDSKPNPKP